MDRLFRQQLAEHNRHCWLVAIGCLIGAGFGWAFYFTLYSGGVFLLLTISTGNVDLQDRPAWFWPVALGVFTAMLVLATIGRWRRPFLHTTDRPIIGWHLPWEIFLLPARLTLGIRENIAARIHLSAPEQALALNLLSTIVERRRISPRQLATEVTDTVLLQRLLETLQVTGWINLHRSDDDWFYTLRSDMEETWKAHHAPPPEED